MKEKRLQKNSVFSIKTDCILLITALIASILFLISPFAVSAQEADVENTETVFEDEAETVPDMNQILILSRILPWIPIRTRIWADSYPVTILPPKIIPFMLLLKMDLAIQTAVMQSLPVMMLWVSEILLMERSMPAVQTEVVPPEKRFFTSLSCYWKTVIFPARH